MFVYKTWQWQCVLLRVAVELYLIHGNTHLACPDLYWYENWTISIIKYALFMSAQVCDPARSSNSCSYLLFAKQFVQIQAMFE